MDFRFLAGFLDVKSDSFVKGRDTVLTLVLFICSCASIFLQYFDGKGTVIRRITRSSLTDALVGRPCFTITQVTTTLKFLNCVISCCLAYL